MFRGDRLRDLRKNKDMTQANLGKLLNMSHSAINRYENSINLPDINTVSKLSEVFNVSTDYLLDKSDLRNVKNCSTHEEFHQLAIDIIEIYIKKGKIKKDERLTQEHKEKILREIEALIDMTNKLDGN